VRRSNLLNSLASLATATALLWSCSTDAPTASDNRDPDLPSFHHDATYAHCRYWGSGTATKWVGPGSTWEGACPVQVTASPSPYMGTMNQGPITFTFAEPVKDIQGHHVYTCSTSYCPTVHASVTAYGPDNVTVVYSGPFRGADGASNMYSFDLRGIGRIKRIVINPPDPLPPPNSQGVSLMFGFDYSVYCPPTLDALGVLDDAAVRAGLLQALAESRPTADGVGRTEIGGYVYMGDDGRPFLVRETRAGFTECNSPLLPSDSVPVVAGARHIAYWHTHPNKEGEIFSSPECGSGVTTSVKKAGRRSETGGGSSADWGFANKYQMPVYSIDYPAKNIWRFDPGTPANRWRNNPNRWKTDTQSQCFLRR
jgi:hypothetical protein